MAQGILKKTSLELELVLPWSLTQTPVPQNAGQEGSLDRWTGLGMVGKGGRGLAVC